MDVAWKLQAPWYSSIFMSVPCYQCILQFLLLLQVPQCLIVLPHFATLVKAKGMAVAAACVASAHFKFYMIKMSSWISSRLQQNRKGMGTRGARWLRLTLALSHLCHHPPVSRPYRPFVFSCLGPGGGRQSTFLGS